MESSHAEPRGLGLDEADELEVAFRAHASHVLRLAYVLTGQREAAEDVTQEAFVRLGRRVLKLKDPDHVHAYLLRTAINLCRGRGRRHEAERRALSRLPVLSPVPPPDVAHDDTFWKALLILPKRQGAALFLRYYLDQSESRSAEILGCSASALKSLVTRGLRTLRDAAQGEEA